MTACASHEHRPRPLKIEGCKEIAEKIRYRDHFYRGLRGRAWAKSPNLTVDLELALWAPSLARIEMTGPLGIRVGLMVDNNDWLQLYVPRERTVFRFPTAEAYRDTARRDRFFSLLPFRFDPDLMVSALETRVDLEDGLTPRCIYDESRNAYRLHFARGEGSRLVWVDPSSMAPLEVLIFDRGLPDPASKDLRPDARLEFSQFTGAGPATLPSHIEFYSPHGKLLTFEWISAEVWDGADPAIFDWRPPASMGVRDY